MKIVFQITCYLLILCATSSFAQSPALDYMSSLSEPRNELEDETWEYLKTLIKGKKAKTVENKRKQLVSGYTDAINQVHKVKSYKDDEILKPAVLNYLRLTKQSLNEEYAKIVDMEAIAEKSYDNMEAYLMAKEEVNKKMDMQYQELAAAQQKFADQYNINIVDSNLSERQQKIKRAGECLGYEHRLFLIYFKAIHQEGYVMEALNNKDINALEQSLSTLSQFADEGLGKLADISSFKSDGSLKEATKNVLKFFKNEAEKELTVVTDFLLLEQEFVKATKRMESKNKKDITQEDVDTYNELVEKYNAAIETYNSTMNKFDKNRMEALNKYEKTRNQFITKNG